MVFSYIADTRPQVAAEHPRRRAAKFTRKIDAPGGIEQNDDIARFERNAPACASTMERPNPAARILQCVHGAPQREFKPRRVETGTERGGWQKTNRTRAHDMEGSPERLDTAWHGR